MTRRVLAVFSAALATAALIGTASSAASPPAHGPDLVLISLAHAPVGLMPGSTFSERFAEANRGDRNVRATKTGFYLSRTGRVGRGAFRLGGTVRVRALKARRKAATSAWLTVSASTPNGSYSLIACANDRHKVHERNTRNDCRVAKGRITVTSSGSLGGSGSAGGSSGGSSGGSGGSGGTGSMCVPTRHPTLSSTNPRCFDGDAAHGIFVSGLGDDTNPGTITAPKKTLAAGVAAALAQGKDLYVAEGIFPETLGLVNGVAVYGGYDGAWQRSPSNITKITGSSGTSEAVDAFGITTPTTLQLVTLEPSTPTVPGESSYGLRGAGSPGLVLDHVTILAAPGEPGRAGPNGSQGVSGGDGGPGDLTAANRGSSSAGHPGGNGGMGSEDGTGALDGGQGVSTTPDMWGESGGFGGNAGLSSSNPLPGGKGLVGGSGHFGAEGAGGTTSNAATPGSGLWVTEPGQNGQTGSAGHGGGGGGGGGSDGCTVGSPLAIGGSGGGGGGGGAGGGGGTGGQGGGGSFGIFLDNSVGALIRDSSVNASSGGGGGPGGLFGLPGAGGAGGPGQAAMPGGGACTAGAAAGGAGGAGGSGGVGGDGGGGAGGPSVAISGLTAAATPGTSVSHKNGGAGSPGDGGAGADGLAADYL